MIGGMEDTQRTANLTGEERVVFAVGVGFEQIAAIRATSAPADELARYGHAFLREALAGAFAEPAVVAGPGVYVWTGRLVASGETLAASDRPVPRWEGETSAALPEEIEGLTLAAAVEAVNADEAVARVVFAAGLDVETLAVLAATGERPYSALDELQAHDFAYLYDVVGDDLGREGGVEAPGVYVWEGRIEPSGETAERGGDRYPVMRWSGRTRPARVEEVLAVNGDWVPSPAASAGEET